MNLQKLVSSQASYQKLKDKTLQVIGNETQRQNILRNIVLFCKQVFSSNTNQRKKYLCLLLIKDIFQNINSQYYQKLVDQYLSLKLLQVVQIYLQGKSKDSRVTGDDEKQLLEKVYLFSLETIVFWAKRLCFMVKSGFSQAYAELKKMKIDIPREFTYYKRQMLISLWSAQKKQDVSNECSAIIMQLSQRFRQCKQQLQKSINESVINDDQVNTKPIVQSLRNYLLFFFSKYRELDQQQSQDRDIIIVYFHILNNLYKRICNQIHISVQEMISLVKEIFQTVYPPEYDSVNRIDMVELAGVFKYNALTIFQRIHHRIEKEDALLGSIKLNLNLQQSQRPPLPSNLESTVTNSRTLNQKITKNTTF